MRNPPKHVILVLNKRNEKWCEGFKVHTCNMLRSSNVSMVQSMNHICIVQLAKGFSIHVTRLWITNVPIEKVGPININVKINL